MQCQSLISVDRPHFFAPTSAGRSLRLRAKKKKILPAIGYLSLLEFFIWESRKGTKPQRGLDLCAFPSLRDILLFFFTQSRKGTKPQRCLDLRGSPSLRDLFFSFREKIKMPENEPSLWALALMSLVPWSLKKVLNFRSPQKTQVTCH